MLSKAQSLFCLFYLLEVAYNFDCGCFAFPESTIGLSNLFHICPAMTLLLPLPYERTFVIILGPLGWYGIISSFATLVPYAILIKLCTIRYYIHRFWGLGHGYLWRPVLYLSYSRIGRRVSGIGKKMTYTF